MGQDGLDMTSGLLSTGTVKGGNETELTYSLKWAAWRWLYAEAGCRAIGFEVRLEGPGGRIADVVGVDGSNRVYLVEVKTSRADLLKDHKTGRDQARLKERVAALEEAAEFTRQLLGTSGAASPVVEDAGRNGSGPPEAQLVGDMVEHAESSLVASKRRMKTFSIKFHDPAYLRCADFHYIAAPRGLVWPYELPPYWGLIDEQGETLRDAEPKQVRRVTTHILRNIAKANTRDLMKACGQEFPPSGRESS
jgi:hypothetical protein